MQDILHRGRISFINLEKAFATIEYSHNGGKSKSVNFKTTIEGTGKKAHQFRLGDTVSFRLRLSDRGDKLAAYEVKFLHNTELDLLKQRAAIENRFSGYFKVIDGALYVKEINSYILFPLRLSPWEVPPVSTAENEAISFSLVNLDKPNGMAAELFSHNYTAAYKKAVQHFNNEIEADAVVTRITPHSVYVALFDGAMQAKLPANEKKAWKEGDSLPVRITHLTPQRVVVQPVEASTGL